MRDDMQVGDRVLFYASNADPSGVAGLATVSRAGYPDPFAMRKAMTTTIQSTPRDKPIWFSVEIAFVERFANVIPLATLKETRGLQKMMVTSQAAGCRSSRPPSRVRDRLSHRPQMKKGSHRLDTD